MDLLLMADKTQKALEHFKKCFGAFLFGPALFAYVPHTL
jgi:predicted phage gp36 major capsid-like protein